MDQSEEKSISSGCCSVLFLCIIKESFVSDDLQPKVQVCLIGKQMGVQYLSKLCALPKQQTQKSPFYIYPLSGQIRVRSDPVLLKDSQAVDVEGQRVSPQHRKLFVLWLSHSVNTKTVEIPALIEPSRGEMIPQGFPRVNSFASFASACVCLCVCTVHTVARKLPTRSRSFPTEWTRGNRLTPAAYLLENIKMQKNNSQKIWGKVWGGERFFVSFMKISSFHCLECELFLQFCYFWVKTHTY